MTPSNDASVSSSADEQPGVAATATSRAGDVIARLDRIPVLTGMHRAWLLLLAGAFLFELADIQLFGMAAPALRANWQLSVRDIGTVSSALFLGMLVGSPCGGWLGDRFGRRRALIGSTVFYSVFCLTTAAATSFATLLVARFLTGIGVAAMTVIGMVYLAEMFPRASRGRCQSLVLGIALCGTPGVSFIARVVVPASPDGWRWLFVIGSLGILVALAMIPLLPESMRWQATTGRADQAQPLLARIELAARQRTGAELPLPDTVGYPPSRGRVGELFEGRYRRRTLALWSLWLFTLSGFYGFSGWVPTLLAAQGYSMAQSLTYNAILTLGAVPGALLAWPVTDRWNRRTLMIAVLLTVAALVLVYGFVQATSVVLIAGFLIAMLLQTISALYYSYTGEVFPTRLRGVGAGSASAAGRVGAVIGSLMVATIYSSFGFASVFVYLASVLTAAALILVRWGERTSRRSLEQIAP